MLRFIVLGFSVVEFARAARADTLFLRFIVLGFSIVKFARAASSTTAMRRLGRSS